MKEQQGTFNEEQLFINLNTTEWMFIRRSELCMLRGIGYSSKCQNRPMRSPIFPFVRAKPNGNQILQCERSQKKIFWNDFEINRSPNHLSTRIIDMANLDERSLSGAVQCVQLSWLFIPTIQRSMREHQESPRENQMGMSIRQTETYYKNHKTPGETI